MPPRQPRAVTPPIIAPCPPLPTPSVTSQSLRMSYRIARGEQGVLTFEPYKSLLLPYWRFKTPAIASASSSALKTAFDSYVTREDFVGADMVRKFIQMGMTRAKRYANHKGGRKYEKSEKELDEEGQGGKRVELPKSEGHEGMEGKLEASEIFKKVWRECTSDGRYLALKAEFVKDQKEWDRSGKKVKKEEIKAENEDAIKVEDEDA